MQSATTRALEKINESEDIQQKLEGIQESLAKAESAKYEALKAKISNISSFTSKVPDKLVIKNQLREDEHLSIWDKSLKKR